MITRKEKIYLLILNNVALLAFISLGAKWLVERNICEDTLIQLQTVSSMTMNLNMCVMIFCFALWILTIAIFIVVISKKKQTKVPLKCDGTFNLAFATSKD